MRREPTARSGRGGEEPRGAGRRKSESGGEDGSGEEARRRGRRKGRRARCTLTTALHYPAVSAPTTTTTLARTTRVRTRAWATAPEYRRRCTAPTAGSQVTLPRERPSAPRAFQAPRRPRAATLAIGLRGGGRGLFVAWRRAVVLIGCGVAWRAAGPWGTVVKPGTAAERGKSLRHLAANCVRSQRRRPNAALPRPGPARIHRPSGPRRACRAVGTVVRTRSDSGDGCSGAKVAGATNLGRGKTALPLGRVVVAVVKARAAGGSGGRSGVANKTHAV
ncbi:Protein of unknown function [Gryllus bimaculatus]|nr:Protein of unknown function [Gryllus bimaculatus]